MKKLTSLFLTCTLIFTLTACGDKTPEQETVHGAVPVEVNLISTHFDAYAYQISSVEPQAWGFIHAALAHADRLYYVTFETDLQSMPAMVITSVNTDGSDEKRVEMQSPGNEVASFNITDDGNFAFFILNRTFSQQGFDLTAFYIEYDRTGVELTRHEIREFTLIEHPQPNTFALLSDGRILAIDINQNILREIDFTNNDLSEAYLVAEDTGRLHGIFSASTNSHFDFLVSDDSYLYGYNIEANEQTILLNWIELGFTEIYTAQIVMFDDGRIFMLAGGRSVDDEWVTELYILSPVTRNEMPETITLTLGALSVQQDVRRAVAQFNRLNSPYRIEIYEYVNQADFPWGDISPGAFDSIWDQAIMRFQVDLMAGNVPDIIFNPTDVMIDRGFLLDLNPFIDADPDINRADFFPNAFTETLRSDGTLPVISHKFSLRTSVGSKETIGHIETLTLAELLSLIRNSQDMALPLGNYMIRENLLDTVRYLNLGFFDFDNFQANFDSDEFIDFINTAKLLPSVSDLTPELMFADPVFEIRRIQEGNQILSFAFFMSVGKYQLFAESIDGYIELGIPTATGAIHTIGHNNAIGIGINTNHTDAAWEFLRSFLLPSAVEFERDMFGDLGFPLRIDLFNELIEDAMTPRIFDIRDGEIIEFPREIFTAYDGSARIELLAMSEETANGLRALIDSSVNPGRGIGDELWAIIKGDLADFYSGAKTAEETARIIQNRAERWLSEQQLLAGN